MAWTDNFRDNLRSAMNRKKMSQQDLARKSGVHFVTVSRILNGVMIPSVELCEKLAGAAGFSSPKVFSENLSHRS